MRKSNWMIAGIFVVASVIFLAMWYGLGFNLVDDPLDLVVSIIWWVVIVGICIAIKVAENRRRRSIRTSFIAPGIIYNPEAGIVNVEESRSYTPALQRVLGSLKYDFDKKDVANDKRIRFTHIVHSDIFSHDGEQWSGEVVKVANPDDVRPFQNMRELAGLIDAA